MTRLILILALSALACQSAAVAPATQAQPTPTVTLQAQSERMVQRITPTVRALHTCEVTADVLTVRACGDVTCLALDWLDKGEIVTTTQPITGWVWTGGGFINSVFCKEVK